MLEMGANTYVNSVYKDTNANYLWHIHCNKVSHNCSYELLPVHH